MRRWSEIAEQVAGTPKTSHKTSILGGYLAGLPVDELPIAALFLTGRPFAEADQRTIGIGWAGISSAVLRVADADPDALRRAYDRSSDVATAVAEVLTETGHPPGVGDEPTLSDVRAAFEAIGAASGPAAKAAILEALLARSSPATAAGIVKVLTGELRIGLREGLLEAAIATAFDRPLDAVKRAGMLTGDVGRTATLAREDRLADATLTVFHPLTGRGCRRDHRSPRAHGVGRGQVRRDPRPVASRRRPGPRLLARPPRHQRPVSGGDRGCGGTAVGRGPRR
jgi:DNA ligase-1